MSSARRRVTRQARRPTLLAVPFASSLVAMLAALVFAVAPAAAAPDDPGKVPPSVVIEDQQGAAGPVTMVQLRSWPLGPVTVAICGDDARRSSQDCDPLGAVNLQVPLGGVAAVRLPQLTPPIDCPCVVRVAAQEHRLTVRVPVVVPGRRVMRPEEMPPDPNLVPRAEDLTVAAVLEDNSSWMDVARAAVGAETRRTFVVTVTNHGSSEMAGLRPSGSFGPAPDPGQPLTMPAVPTLQVGEQHVERIPVTIPAATFGTFVGSGRILGLDAPVTFRASADRRPWGIAIILVAAFVVFATLKLVRRRRRKRLA